MDDLILEQTENFVRFKVDEIERAKEALEEHALGEEESILYSTFQLKTVSFNPSFVEAILLAYRDHRPIMISPDMIWLTLLQGFSHHIANNSEALRDTFVSHPGKLKITQVRSSFPKEEEWEKIIETYLLEVNFNLKENVSLLISDFTTTNWTEKIASHITLLKAFQPYFDYAIMVGCGIPEITITGTTEDWIKLKEKAERLEKYDLDWWIPKVLLVLEEFIQASKGIINLRHWKNICKLEEDYGVNQINGWVTSLFPYTKDSITRQVIHKNKLLTQNENSNDVFFNMDEFPNGTSEVIINYEIGEERGEFSLVAGFLGILQNRKTKYLRPEIGWKVEKKTSTETIFTRLNEIGTTYPPLSSEQIKEKLENMEFVRWNGFSKDLMEFYHTTNGLRIKKFALSLIPFEQIENIYTMVDHEVKENHLIIGKFDNGTKLIYQMGTYSNEIAYIDLSGKELVVEIFFSSFLEKILNSRDIIYFLENDFSNIYTEEYFSG